MAVRVCYWLMACFLMTCCGSNAQLRDPSQETVYLIMIDRFVDGNPANNPPDPIFSRDRTAWKMYWGGDFKGITSKLDYLQALGVTSILITPIVQNTDAVYRYNFGRVAAYHGYWGLDFGALNPYFGTPDDLDQLLKQAHQRKMKVFLDVVVNHTSPVEQGVDGAVLRKGQRMATFGNDPSGWFHHKPSIQFNNDTTEEEMQTGRLFDLADLNQSNPEVSEYLIQSYEAWIKRGFDGIRIDTARHVAPEWLATFVGRLKKIKPTLYVVGEWWGGGNDVPNAVNFSHKVGARLIDFRLRDELLQMFTNRDAHWQTLVRYLAKDKNLDEANENLVFIDNHDTPRFLSACKSAGASEADARRKTMAATFLMMTIRGIPCLTWGTEYLYHNETPTDMGAGNDPYNRPMMAQFDTTGPFFNSIKSLAKLRIENPALGKGAHVPRVVTQDLYAFERRLGDNVVLVAVNKGAPQSVTVQTALQTGSYEPREGGPKRCILGPSIQVQSGSTTFNLDQWQVGVWSFQASPRP